MHQNAAARALASPPTRRCPLPISQISVAWVPNVEISLTREPDSFLERDSTSLNSPGPASWGVVGVDGGVRS